MCRKVWLLLLLIVCFATVSSAAKDKFTLVIDAGHGGNDAGAIGKISKEKNINLNVALAFGRYVENNCPDVKVIYTRKTDIFIPLHQRADIANKNKADLFISIHTNALPAKRIARGLETYTLGIHRAADNFDVAKRENSVILIEKDYKQHYEGFDPRSSESYIMFEFMQDKNMEKSVELAKAVQKRTCAAAGRPNKGVKQAGFLVLRETSMPSCLIELGFITTPDEEQFLNSKSGIDALGKGIYQAFLDYKSKYGKPGSVPYKAESANTSNSTATTVAKVKTTETKAKRQTEAKQEVKATSAETKAKAAEPKANTSEVKAKAQPEIRTTAPRVQPGTKPEKKTEVKDSKSIIAELTDARNGVTKETPSTPDKAPEKPKHEAAATPSRAAIQASGTVAKQTPPQTESMPETAEPATRAAEQAATPPAVKDTAPEDNTSETTGRTEPTVNEASAEPVFKVQILASSNKLASSDRQLKGQKNVDTYQENGLYKYTVGASTDYNEIYRLRKSIIETFPEAFIIAFKDGRKMNVNDAIREFKANKNNR